MATFWRELFIRNLFHTIIVGPNDGGVSICMFMLINQRTNGLVNARLLSGPSKSTQHTNPK